MLHQVSKMVSWEAHCSPIHSMRVHSSVLWDLTFDLLVEVTWTGAKSWTQVVSWAPWGHVIAVCLTAVYFEHPKHIFLKPNINRAFVSVSEFFMIPNYWNNMAPLANQILAGIWQVSILGYCHEAWLVVNLLVELWMHFYWTYEWPLTGTNYIHSCFYGNKSPVVPKFNI